MGETVELPHVTDQQHAPLKMIPAYRPRSPTRPPDKGIQFQLIGGPRGFPAGVRRGSRVRLGAYMSPLFHCAIASLKACCAPSAFSASA